MFKRRSSDNETKRQALPRGTTRGEVFSYHEARNPRSTETSRRPESIRKESEAPPRPKGHFIQLTFLILLILVVLFDLTLGSTPRVIVEKISSAALPIRSQTDYQHVANQVLSSSIMNRTKITINENDIAAKLEGRLPELASVSIEVPLIGRQPVITLIPASPALIITSGTTHYVVGNSGKVLLVDPAALSDFKSLPQIATPIATSPSILGQPIIAPNDISFIQLVSAEIAGQKMTPVSYTIPAASRELDVSITGLPYAVKFNLADNGSVKQQLGSFFATRAYLVGKGITPAQYIDVRIPTRVFYK